MKKENKNKEEPKDAEEPCCADSEGCCPKPKETKVKCSCGGCCG
jgi:hypothetical protein